MPRPKTITLTMAASDDDAICASQTPSGAGALTLNGARVTSGVATLDVPRHLLLTTGADESSKTVSITGTDRYGNVLTTSTTLPNNTTKIVAYNFKTVTGITIDAATAAVIKIGTANALNSQWIPLDWHASDATTITISPSTGSNLTYSTESTVDNVQASGFVESDAEAQTVSVLGGTTDVQALLTGPLTALRFGLSNFVSGSVTITLLQRRAGK